MKALEIDAEEEELSPDSACSTESDQVHSDQAHDRELLKHYLSYSVDTAAHAYICLLRKCLIFISLYSSIIILK